jgi:AcrR family transcriptional regulator
VLRAAHEVFSVRGPGAEIQEIGQRAGVGMGTIYRNFGSKEGLLQALVREFERDVLALIRGAAEHRDARTAFTVFIGGMFDLAETYGAIARGLSEAGMLPHKGEMSEPEQELVALVERGRASGVIRGELPAEFVVALLRNAMMLYIEMRPGVPGETLHGWCAESFVRAAFA